MSSLSIFKVKEAKGAPLFRIRSQFEIPEIERKSQFNSHSAELRAGTEEMNEQADIAHQRLIGTGELVGLTVKSRMNAQLKALPLG